MDRDWDTEMALISDYVRNMINSGYDALDLEVFAKKFKGIDYTRILQRLGCEVVEDIVLLRLPDDADYEDDFF